MVTRGSQQAIDLVARALLAPGDVVAVESLGNPGTWNALRLAGRRAGAAPASTTKGSTSTPWRARLSAAGCAPSRHAASPVSHDGLMRRRDGRDWRRSRSTMASRSSRTTTTTSFTTKAYRRCPSPPAPAAPTSSTSAPCRRCSRPGCASASSSPRRRCSSGWSRARGERSQGDSAVECALAELLRGRRAPPPRSPDADIYARRRDALAAALDAPPRQRAPLPRARRRHGALGTGRGRHRPPVVGARRRGSRVLFCGARVHASRRANPLLAARLHLPRRGRAGRRRAAHGARMDGCRKRRPDWRKALGSLPAMKPE